MNPQNDSTSEAPNNFIASISDGKKPATTPANVGQSAQDVDLRIAYLTGAQASSVKQPKPQLDLTINRRDAWFQSEGLIIKGTGFAVRLENLAGLTRAELVKIATGLELAPNPNDPSTWFDAATAIP